MATSNHGKACKQSRPKASNENCPCEENRQRLTPSHFSRNPLENIPLTDLPILYLLGTSTKDNAACNLQLATAKHTAYSLPGTRGAFQRLHQGSGFRVQGSGLRVQGSGFRVQGLEFRV